MTHKEERAAYNDINMNCNACLHLVRIKRKKDKWGFLYGRCQSLEETPYPCEYGYIKFHPSDWMGMSCFINRDTGKASELALQPTTYIIWVKQVLRVVATLQRETSYVPTSKVHHRV